MPRARSTLYIATTHTQAAPRLSGDADRVTHALTLLAAVQPAVRAALGTLPLCPEAPAWPAVIIRTATQARAVRAAAARTRRHATGDQACACRPEDARTVVRIIDAWLSLYRTGCRYIDNPNLYDLASLTRTARYAQDCATWTVTGNPGDILGTDRTPPHRTPARTAIPGPPPQTARPGPAGTSRWFHPQQEPTQDAEPAPNTTVQIGLTPQL